MNEMNVSVSGMRIRIQIRSDPLILGPPDPVLFSTNPDPDPDPDPTCNNGFIKNLYLEQNINQNQQLQA